MQFMPDGRFEWTANAIRNEWMNLNTLYQKCLRLNVVVEKSSTWVIGEAGILLLKRFPERIPEVSFMSDNLCHAKGLGREIMPHEFCWRSQVFVFSIQQKIQQDFPCYTWKCVKKTI